MDLMHAGLKDFLLLQEYSQEEKVGCLSIENPFPNWFKKFTLALPYTLGLHLRREYRHLSMAFQAFKLKECQTLFIFEVYLQNLFLLLPLLALTRRKILISLHWNQQLARYSKLKYLGLVYLRLFLKWFNFKAIVFEIDDDVIPQKYRLSPETKIVLPMPVRSDAYPKLKPGERLSPDAKLKIGVVGKVRKDKPIAKLIESLKTYVETQNSELELIIGTPRAQQSDYLKQLGVTVRDTTSEADYLGLLNELDILVAYYDEVRYYYRTSGVVSDAACSGCYVIASDYPTIAHQITAPVEVGATFSSFEEIGSIVDRAIPQIRERGQDLHWVWRETRSIDAIAKILFPQDRDSATEFSNGTERQQTLARQ